MPSEKHTALSILHPAHGKPGAEHSIAENLQRLVRELPGGKPGSSCTARNAPQRASTIHQDGGKDTRQRREGYVATWSRASFNDGALPRTPSVTP